MTDTDGGSDDAASADADDTDATPPADLAGLLGPVEESLLGGPRHFTRGDVAQRSGLDPDEIRGLWRSLGFAAVGDDDRVFTDADLDALARVQELRESADLDEDLVRAIVRILGQAFSRLASWQGQLIVEIVGRNPELLGSGRPEDLQALVERLVPVVSGLHDYVWRRQLVAVLGRMATNMGAAEGAEAPMAVGFVDMAGFTTLTRRSSEAELRSVLTRFETLTTDVVGACHGQIVKTIGDEVLYVADGPAAAADIALTLLESAAADDALPAVRAGVAFGPVVNRLGDVFGATVNIASRLTSAARTDSVLVDDGMSSRLRDDDRFVLHALRPMSVRGYHHLRSWRLRRAG